MKCSQHLANNCFLFQIQTQVNPCNTSPSYQEFKLSHRASTYEEQITWVLNFRSMSGQLYSHCGFTVEKAIEFPQTLVKEVIWFRQVSY